MTLVEHCDRLIDQLGRRFGIDGLAFDGATGTCVLGFDRSLKVWLAPDGLSDSIVLFAMLGTPPPPPRRAALLQAMLCSNFMWRAAAGAMLALDAEHDQAVLTLPLPARAIDAEQLEMRLNAFVDVALDWVERLRLPAVELSELDRLA